MAKDLTEFNSGGTHEQNPLGGIPQGVAPDGRVNTVEEGETKVSLNGTDYVFSNSISTKDNYVKDYYLPPYIKNKTFSEASKAIEKRFEDKQDNASMSTKDAMYRRLAEAQEYARLEKQASDAGMSVEDYQQKLAEQEQQAQLDAAAEKRAQDATQPGGGMPQAPEGAGPAEQVMQAETEMQPTMQFEEGGFMNFLTKGSEASGAQKTAAVTGGVTALAGLGISNVQATEKQSIGGAAAKGAIAGGAAGATLGPIGMAAGAVLGAGAGAITAKIGNDKALDAHMDEKVAVNKGKMLTASGRKYGGPMETKDYNEGGGMFSSLIKDRVYGRGFLGGFGGGGFGGGGADGDWARYTAPREYEEGIDNNLPYGIVNNADPSLEPSDVLPTRRGREYAKFNITPGTPVDTPLTPSTLKSHPGFSTADVDSEYTGEDDGEGFPWVAAASGAAQLAPFIGNIAEGARLSKPDKNHLARVGRTYLPEFADERRLLNVVDDSYSGDDDAIASATAGNLGAYRSNILGSSVNRSRSRMQAFNQINEINRGERKNLNEDFANAAREEVDKYNIEQDLDKQDMAAYDAAKQSYRVAAYEGLGELGKTIFTLNQAEGLTSYDYLTGKKKKD